MRNCNRSIDMCIDHSHMKFAINLSGLLADLVGFLTWDSSLIWSTAATPFGHGLIKTSLIHYCWRCGGLMVSALDSRLSSLGLSPVLGHCVVFLGKILYSHSASLHPGVQMGTGDKMLGVTCEGLASHPGGVTILLVGSKFGPSAAFFILRHLLPITRGMFL